MKKNFMLGLVALLALGSTAEARHEWGYTRILNDTQDEIWIDPLPVQPGWADTFEAHTRWLIKCNLYKEGEAEPSSSMELHHQVCSDSSEGGWCVDRAPSWLQERGDILALRALRYTSPGQRGALFRKPHKVACKVGPSDEVDDNPNISFTLETVDAENKIMKWDVLIPDQD